MKPMKNFSSSKAAFCGVLGVVLASATSNAETITFGFTGVITYSGVFSDGSGNLPTVTSGDTFSGSYTFESTTANNSTQVGFGSYEMIAFQSPYQYQVTLGGNLFAIDNSGPNHGLGIHVGTPASQYSGYASFYQANATSAVGFGTINGNPARLIYPDLWLTTNDNSKGLSSIALPLTAPPLSAFDELNFHLTVQLMNLGPNNSPYQGSYFGTISSLFNITDPVFTVPLHPSVVSQITGLAMLGGLLAWRRRRK
jgi:hypothetical protein